MLGFVSFRKASGMEKGLPKSEFLDRLDIVEGRLHALTVGWGSLLIALSLESVGDGANTFRAKLPERVHLLMTRHLVDTLARLEGNRHSSMSEGFENHMEIMGAFAKVASRDVTVATRKLAESRATAPSMPPLVS